MYIIPAIAGVTGYSIILSDNLSTNGIMLNLLAVLFITEADNLFASLFFSPYQQVLGDELAQEAKNEVYDKYSSWVVMVHPLMVSLTMVLLTVNMHGVMKLVGIWFNLKWGCIGTFMTYSMYILTVPWLSMLVVWMITSDERERKMIRILLYFSRFTTSFCVYSMCTSLYFRYSMDSSRCGVGYWLLLLRSYYGQLLWV